MSLPANRLRAYLHDQAVQRLGSTAIDLFKRHPFFPVLILSLCFMPLAHIMTASDDGHYLRVAKDFINGKGYHSGRIHSFFIAIAFWLGGISISSAYWVNRVFWLLNLVVVYLLGRELFDSRRIGALAALLLLSSYVFNYWAFRMSLGIDLPFALFCNLFLLVAIAAIKHNRMILFVLAGIVMSLAFTVKESSVLYFGVVMVPVFFVRIFRTRRRVLGLLVMLVVALVCYRGIGVGSNLNYSSQSLNETLNASNRAEGSVTGFSPVLEKYIRGLRTFVSRQVIHSFGPSSMLFCLMPIAGAVGMIFAPVPWLIYWSVMLPTTVAMAGFGILHMRFGQVLPQFVLSYVFVAATLVACIDLLKRWLSPIDKSDGLSWKNRLAPAAAMLVVMVPVLTVELCQTAPFLLKNSAVLNGFPRLKVSGEIFTSEMENFARWVDKTTDARSPVIIEAPGELYHSAKFFTQGSDQRLKIFIPYQSYAPMAHLFIPIERFDSGDRALALWLNRKGLTFFSEAVFLDYLRQHDARYYLLSTMCPAVTRDYLEASTDQFSPIAQAFEGPMTMRLFRITHPLKAALSVGPLAIIVDTSGWSKTELAQVPCSEGRAVIRIAPEPVDASVAQAAMAKVGLEGCLAGRVTIFPGNQVFYLATARQTLRNGNGYRQLFYSRSPDFEQVFHLRIDDRPVGSHLFQPNETSTGWLAMVALCRKLVDIGPEVEIRWHLSREGALGFTLKRYVQLSF